MKEGADSKSGLYIDAHSDLLSTGPCSAICGEVKPSTFAPSSMPTETSMNPDGNEYVLASPDDD